MANGNKSLKSVIKRYIKEFDENPIVCFNHIKEEDKIYLDVEVCNIERLFTILKQPDIKKMYYLFLLEKNISETEHSNYIEEMLDTGNIVSLMIKNNTIEFGLHASINDFNYL
jgi:hypothetical protein